MTWRRCQVADKILLTRRSATDSAYQSGGSGVLSLEQSGTTRSPLVSDMFFKLYATFHFHYKLFQGEQDSTKHFERCVSM